jgi:hypothetical protein
MEASEVDQSRSHRTQGTGFGYSAGVTGRTFAWEIKET